MKGWMVFGAGAVIGAVAWWVSPWVFGAEEPWDANGFRYPIVLFAAGVLLARLAPVHWWVGPCGLYVGQFLYCLLKPEEGGGVNFFLPLGAMFLVAATFPALLGAMLTRLEWGRAR